MLNSSDTATRVRSPDESRWIRWVRLPRGAAWMSISLSSGSSGLARRSSHSPPPNRVWNTRRKLAWTAANVSTNRVRAVASISRIAWRSDCRAATRSSRWVVRNSRRLDSSACSSAASGFTRPMILFARFVELGPERLDRALRLGQHRAGARERRLGLGGGPLEPLQRVGALAALLPPLGLLRLERDALLVQLDDLPLEGSGRLFRRGDGLRRALQALPAGAHPRAYVRLLHLPVDPAFAGGLLLGLHGGQLGSSPDQGLLLEGPGRLSFASGGVHLPAP